MRIKLPTVQVTEVNHAEAGATIRELRKKSGMSLRALAKQMGFSAPFVSDLERGHRNWSEENFKKAVEIITK